MALDDGELGDLEAYRAFGLFLLECAVLTSCNVVLFATWKHDHAPSICLEGGGETQSRGSGLRFI